MVLLPPDLLSRLRRDPRLLTIPPYLSLLLIVGGIVWICVIPLNQFSRQTYISENALLPGQVHTYFGGSEQNVFRAYRHEIASVASPDLEIGRSQGQNESQIQEAASDRSDKIVQIFRNGGLKTARQRYSYQSAGKRYAGENVYAVLHAPRGDGTEAIVLVAALKNTASELNVNGVTLLLSLARYFERWSLWSKDIIFLVTSDSDAGPQAWIDAYHSTHDAATVEDLSLKSGALQGAVCIDYPFEHRFESLHIAYDGINGQLPNLDLFNTAVAIASGQMGISTSIQHMYKHSDSYRERLSTLTRGMSSQALGHATGPHSVFMPYHIDAITLTATGEGWQDEMAFGRVVESLCRSLNNLLEHLHQSFFFYLLFQANRFVSIGTYLPSAMVIAAAFSVMALHLWVKAGRAEPSAPNTTGKAPSPPKPTQIDTRAVEALEREKTSTSPPPASTDRALALPIVFITLTHALALLPIYLTTTLKASAIPQSFTVLTLASLLVPIIIASALPELPNNTSLPPLPAPTPSQYTLIKSLSLLTLGLLLTVLATLNFSLSLLLGLAASPLIFVSRTPNSALLAAAQYLFLLIFSPFGAAAAYAAYTYHLTGDIDALPHFIERLAFGWNIWGSWGVLLGVWAVWWPAWIEASVLVASSWFVDAEGKSMAPVEVGKAAKAGEGGEDKKNK